MADVLTTFAIGVSFGLARLSSLLECMDLRGYLAALAFYIVTPIAVALLIVLIVAVNVFAQSRWPEKPPASRKPSPTAAAAAAFTASAVLEAATPLLLQLAFISYPLVTNVAFDAFSCYELADDEWLKVDVAALCADRAQHSP